MLFSNPKVGHSGLAMAEPDRWHLRSDIWWPAGGEEREGLHDGEDNITAWKVSCFTVGWVQVRHLNMLYM